MTDLNRARMALVELISCQPEADRAAHVRRLLFDLSAHLERDSAIKSAIESTIADLAAAAGEVIAEAYGAKTIRALTAPGTPFDHGCVIRFMSVSQPGAQMLIRKGIGGWDMRGELPCPCGKDCNTWRLGVAFPIGDLDTPAEYVMGTHGFTGSNAIGTLPS